MTQPIKSSLFHRIADPRVPVPGGKSPAIILLHGRGASEDDLLPLAEYLDPRFFVIAPRAPNAFPYGGYAWYTIIGLAQPDKKEHEESARLITQLIDDAIREYPIDPEKIFLLGFSMGSMMAMTVSLAQPHRFAGIVAHSGYIPEQSNVQYRWDDLKGSNYFIAHGTYDPVVTVDLGRRAKELMEKTAATIEYHEYPMGHEISRESLADIAAWLSRHLP